MIDFGLRKPAIEIPEREIRQLAQSWVNEPQMQKVALRIAAKCHVPPGVEFAEFRAELAILAAEQYLMGRATGRARIITPPQMPKVRGN